MEQRAQEFLDRIARLLEEPKVAMADDFRAFHLWDSLTAFAIRVLFRQKYSVELSAEELDGCRTVADLAKKAGVTE